MDNSSTEQKRCTLCQQLFPATTEYFHINKMGRFGLQSRCRDCANAVGRGRVVPIVPPDCPDGFKRCSNCDQIYPATTDYFRQRKGRTVLNASCRRCERTYSGEYREENRDVLLEKGREYHHKNKAHIVQRHKANSTPEKNARQLAIRHARKRGLPCSFSKADYARMMEYWGGCAITGQKSDLHLDHWIPLSSPDCPGTIPANMIPLAASLNLSKCNSNPSEWLRWKFGSEADAILAKIEAYFDWLK